MITLTLKRLLPAVSINGLGHSISKVRCIGTQVPPLLTILLFVTVLTLLSGCMTLPVQGKFQNSDELFNGTATGYMDGGGDIVLVSNKGSTCRGGFVYVSRRNGEGAANCDDGRSGPFQFVSTGKRGTGYGDLSGQRYTFTFGNFELAPELNAAKLTLKSPEIAAVQRGQQQPQYTSNRTPTPERASPPKLVFNSSAPKSDGTVELSGRVISDASISEILINGRALEVSLGNDNSFKVIRLPPMGVVTSYRLSVSDEYGQKADAEINVERAAVQYAEQVAPLNPRKLKAQTNPQQPTTTPQ